MLLSKGALACESGQITERAMVPAPSMRAFAPTTQEISCTLAATRALGCT